MVIQDGSGCGQSGELVSRAIMMIKDGSGCEQSDESLQAASCERHPSEVCEWAPSRSVAS